MWSRSLEGAETLRVVLSNESNSSFVAVLHGVTFVKGGTGPGKLIVVDRPATEALPLDSGLSLEASPRDTITLIFLASKPEADRAN